MACLAAKLSSKNLCFVVSSLLFTLHFSSFRFLFSFSFSVLLLFLIFCCCCRFSFYFVYGVRQNATFAFNEHEIMSSSTSSHPLIALPGTPKTAPAAPASASSCFGACLCHSQSACRRQVQRLLRPHCPLAGILLEKLHSI